MDLIFFLIYLRKLSLHVLNELHTLYIFIMRSLVVIDMITVDICF